MLLRMPIRIYPDEDNPDRKVEFILISVLAVPNLQTDSSDVVCQIRAPWLDKPLELQLQGFSAKPDYLALAWAALSVFAVGAGLDGKTLHVEARAEQKPPDVAPAPPRVVKRKKELR